jgi:hypothetical protein
MATNDAPERRAGDTASASLGHGRLSRRTFAKAIGAALLAAAGGVGLVRRRGYAMPPGPALLALSASEYAIVSAIASRIAATDGVDMPSAEEVGVARWVDGYVASMDGPLRRDLLRLLQYVEQLAPTAVGYASRFTRLAPRDQDAVLAGMEASRIPVLRGAFGALKGCIYLGYYRDSRTWNGIGYEGPLLGRTP